MFIDPMHSLDVENLQEARQLDILITSSPQSAQERKRERERERERERREGGRGREREREKLIKKPAPELGRRAKKMRPKQINKQTNKQTGGEAQWNCCL